jgi:hypothetical protein
MSDRWSRASSALAAVVAMATLAACHNVPVDTEEPIERHLGVYRFSQHISGGGTGGENVDIEGQFVVFGDTVTVDARPGPCRLDTRVTMPNPFTYDCGGVTLSFDRRDPIGRAMYSVTVTVTQTRTICVRYAVDSSGRRYCAESRNEPTQRQVKQSGYLRVQRNTG